MSGTGPKRTKRGLERDLVIAVAEEGRLRSKLARLAAEHDKATAQLRTDLYELREDHERTLAALAAMTAAVHDAEADRDYWKSEAARFTEDAGEDRIRLRLCERLLTTAQLADVQRRLTLALNAGPEETAA